MNKPQYPNKENISLIKRYLIIFTIYLIIKSSLIIYLQLRSYYYPFDEFEFDEIIILFGFIFYLFNIFNIIYLFKFVRFRKFTIFDYLALSEFIFFIIPFISIFMDFLFFYLFGIDFPGRYFFGSLVFIWLLLLIQLILLADLWIRFFNIKIREAIQIS